MARTNKRHNNRGRSSNRNRRTHARSVVSSTRDQGRNDRSFDWV